MPRERSPDSCANTSPESSLTEPSRASGIEVGAQAVGEIQHHRAVAGRQVPVAGDLRSGGGADHHAAVLGADPQSFEPALHGDAAVVGRDVALPVDALEPDGAVLGVRHDVAGEIAAGDAAIRRTAVPPCR